ncbi:MAG: ABC-F family ATP-binding cassette domain-containing protein [bacterium]
MSLIVAEGLELFFADRPILGGASFRIGADDRIGLIGPNGTGKSTLLKILAQKQGLDGGSITRSKNLRVGYLSQDILEVGAGGLLETVLRSVPGRTELDRELASLEADLDATSDPDEMTEVAHRLAELHHEILDFDTIYSEARAERILAGLSFRPADFAKPVEQFSGGWRMRAALASLLFQQPDLLLLDEPTNHLDLPSVAWLAEFLRNAPHALVLVCHDREFLDRQVDRVISFEPEGLRVYRGNYSSYKIQRQEEEAILEARAENQERERKRLERFIDKNRARTNTAKLVQSRVKKLDKLDEEKVELRGSHARMRVRFPPVPQTGRVVVKTEGLGKSFGELVLYRDLDVMVPRGERIVLAGVNGAGKTTLLRILAGELPPDAGSVTYGANVKVSYYAQHLSTSLDRRRTLLDEVATAAPSMSPAQIRGILGAFLFRGDDVDKTIGVLSGGEKARVALAKILVAPGNLLLLDEPTNHLDTESSDILADSLSEYDGTILFVSHNLAFARKLATQVWYLENGSLEVYPGSLEEFLERLKTKEDQASARGVSASGGTASAPSRAPARSQDAHRPSPSTDARAPSRPTSSAEQPAAAPPPPPKPHKDKDTRRADAEKRQADAKRLGPLKKRVADVEREISTIESKKKEIETQLADPDLYKDTARFQAMLGEFDKVKAQLDERTRTWEKLEAELESLTASA